ncbi:MAG TPA: tetratricopeptide repeat protein [Candidatus Competibacteraceae bacterium]|nr:tetratricopeptide repeat protein [Candidatus Competibacteraceae bacterium]HRZ04729.1 tetratricopeptide repeat protein [Candidatus Competibacteraceae bacterium]HSA46499.1 tetratricopeptide repeat protein [Candidatus Competibacteraceae bacterium]
MINFKVVTAIVIAILFFDIAYADIVIGRGVPRPDNIDAAIKSEPNNADLYNIRGNNYLMSKNYDKAIQDFTKAIQINTYYKEPYNGLGIAYRNMNQFDKAIQNYSKAISLDPNYFEAYNNRGVAYMFLKDYEGMCSDFKKACSLGSCEKITISSQKGLCK